MELCSIFIEKCLVQAANVRVVEPRVDVDLGEDTGALLALLARQRDCLHRKGLAARTLPHSRHRAEAPLAEQRRVREVVELSQLGDIVVVHETTPFHRKRWTEQLADKWQRTAGAHCCASVNPFVRVSV